MKGVVWGLLGVAVGAGVMWLILSPTGETCPNSVELSLQNKDIAFPDLACVDYPDSQSKGGRVFWTAVGGADGDEVVIKFKNQDPFDNPPIEYRITVVKGSSTTIRSNQAITRPPTGSNYQDFPYGITWYSGDKPPVVVDPTIRIRR